MMNKTALTATKVSTQKKAIVWTWLCTAISTRSCGRAFVCWSPGPAGRWLAGELPEKAHPRSDTTVRRSWLCTSSHPGSHSTLHLCSCMSCSSFITSQDFKTGFLWLPVMHLRRLFQRSFNVTAQHTQDRPTRWEDTQIPPACESGSVLSDLRQVTRLVFRMRRTADA